MGDAWLPFTAQDFQVKFFATEIHPPGGQPWRYPTAAELPPPGWRPISSCVNLEALRKDRPDGSFAYYNIYYKTSGQYGGTRKKRNNRRGTRRNNRK